MNLRSKVNAVTAALLTGALVFLAVVWWMNGREDTWLYATSAIIVLSSFFYLAPPKKDGSQ